MRKYRSSPHRCKWCHGTSTTMLCFGLTKSWQLTLKKEVIDGSYIDVWTPDGWCVFVSHQSYFTNTVFETVGGIQVSAEGQAYLCCMYLTPLIEYWAIIWEHCTLLNILRIAHHHSYLKSIYAIWVQASSLAKGFVKIFSFTGANTQIHSLKIMINTWQRKAKCKNVNVSFRQAHHLWLTLSPFVCSLIRRPWRSTSRNWGPCQQRWGKQSMSVWGPTFLSWSIKLETRRWREWASMEMSSWDRCAKSNILYQPVT